MAETNLSIEVAVGGIARDDLRTLGRSLLDIVDCLLELDKLPPVEDVPVRLIDAQRQDGLDRLSELTTLGTRAVAADLERLPESILVNRLRALNTPWATIAGVTDLQASGLFKRYRKSSD